MPSSGFMKSWSLFGVRLYIAEMWPIFLGNRIDLLRVTANSTGVKIPIPLQDSKIHEYN